MTRGWLQAVCVTLAVLSCLGAAEPDPQVPAAVEPPQTNNQLVASETAQTTTTTATPTSRSLGAARSLTEALVSRFSRVVDSMPELRHSPALAAVTSKVAAMVGAGRDTPPPTDNKISFSKWLRYFTKAVDAVLLAAVTVSAFYFSYDKCFEMTTPNRYRFSVMSSEAATKTDEQAEQDQEQDEEAGKDFERSQEVVVEVMTNNKETVDWGSELGAGGDKAFTVRLNKDAVSGVDYDELSSYLREIQAVQNQHRHGGDTNVGTALWISEDSLWPPVNVPARASDYHIEALKVHDQNPKAFDEAFALPNFMRPKARLCYWQALQGSFSVFIGVLVFLAFSLL